MHGKLNPAEKELVVLHVAWRVGCVCKWAHHAQMADEPGISEEHIVALATHNPVVAEPRLHAFITAAAQLVETGQLDQNTWRAVADVAGDDTALELCMLAVITSWSR
ncbi:carboxymuconolactone decarboxylase family protein [Gordonia insulae]|uniref:Carboxymuconolactone decarboxylase-like domain-containing protein n=1 Tax=Gordonia insulae TaxID=2420509 RepID=A0A3G8JFN4_9ACTN|nr:carboxymuconolactone decarboxylase family protein [Gordonia insulae]AZG43814.1 hypothetical protein D7316_00384 [Gordonia insulae]